MYVGYRVGETGVIFRLINWDFIQDFLVSRKEFLQYWPELIMHGDGGKFSVEYLHEVMSCLTHTSRDVSTMVFDILDTFQKGYITKNLFLHLYDVWDHPCLSQEHFVQRNTPNSSIISRSQFINYWAMQVFSFSPLHIESLPFYYMYLLWTLLLK